MSFTVIIPARLASTRLPNKPIADICGKPMIVRVAEQALKSGASRVICAVFSQFFQMKSGWIPFVLGLRHRPPLRSSRTLQNLR